MLVGGEKQEMKKERKGLPLLPPPLSSPSLDPPCNLLPPLSFSSPPLPHKNFRGRGGYPLSLFWGGEG